MPNQQISNDNLPNPYHVLVIEDPEFRKTIFLEEPAYSLGRDATNSIVLSSRKVSRYHSTILRRIDPINQSYSFWVIDGNLDGERSKNGIFVNDKKTLVQELNHGDNILIGDVKVSYYILYNMSDFIFLQSGDFTKDNKNKIDKDKGINSKATIAISETDRDNLIDPDLSRLASFPELSPNPILELDWQGRITYLNPAALAKFKNIYEAQSQHPILANLINNCPQRQGHLFVREIKIGTEIFEQYVHYLADQKLIRSYIFDFTKRKQLESSLKESKELYHNLIKESSVGIILFDANQQKILEVNKAYGNLIGYNPEELLNLNLLAIFPPESQQKIQEIIAAKQEYLGKLIHRCQNNELREIQVQISFLNYQNREIIYLSAQLGLRDKIETIPTGINNQTTTLDDPITGLASPALFEKILSTTLANCERYQEIMSLILVQVSNFERFQKSLGQSKYEQILKDISQRLQSSLRSGDTIAYLQQSQFGLLLSKIQKIHDIAKISQRILKLLKPAFVIDNQTIYLDFNLGIAIYPEDSLDSNSLKNNAQQALNRSGKNGSSNYQFYLPALTAETSRILRLESLLEQALIKEEFLIYYQPRINVKTNKIIAMEALLRWQNSEFGLLTPAQFLPIAESMGLMIPIGEWVLEHACQQNKLWQEAGFPPFSIAVNIAAVQFTQANFVDKVKAILPKTRLAAQWLELDLTENTVTQNLTWSRETLSELKQVGINLALDDFDPTCSSVGFLKQFPWQTLKIHQAYMARLSSEPQELAIIEAILAMGKEFNLTIAVEGVENQEQLAILQKLNFEEMQGYLLSKPLTKDEVSQWLTTRSHQR